MEIVAGELIRNETNQKAMGGTELMAIKMHETLPKNLLEKCQIIHSRPRELRDDLYKILVCHDLPGDPEVQHLKDGGWNKYDKIVFVSNWQMQMYNAYLGVPYSKSIVIKNAIDPIKTDVYQFEEAETIRVIYHTTPHRGLSILYNVFDYLSKDVSHIHLDVYSSFKIYGWEQRDEPYKDLFEKIKDHPNMTYHGSVSNEEVRQALKESHIFAYPSIWQETSCISLMEAMSAGLVCIHPNLAALPETSSGWSVMYQWHEDPIGHANTFYDNLRAAVIRGKANQYNRNGRLSQKSYFDSMYGWHNRQNEWINLLNGI